MAVGAELSGPGVDPQTKRLRAGSYVIAMTYLTLKPEVEVETVFGLTEPVIAELKTSKGMAAVTFGKSTACHALRTLTVWESEEDLGAFVMGPAHLSAMSHSSALCRGTGNTISWEGTEKDVTWEAAAQQLASESGRDF
ncbi:hypothetical protein BE21_55180 [Sorangium cellulosum]|uniref:DUF3291 domain-containing protein n=1 Tax=Sorangium cellulosum TaxID=56 RepID=A0A150TBW5_SORCE|nr:hypothetical protein BE21_55180 [Sorangium cellulosum]